LIDAVKLTTFVLGEVAITGKGLEKTGGAMRSSTCPAIYDKSDRASVLFLCCLLVDVDDCELTHGFDSILVMMVDDEVLLF
jgi:hypothetical protein